MNALSKYAFQDNNVRIVSMENNPWFYGPDVRRCISLTQCGTNYSNLDPDEVRVLFGSDLTSINLRPSDFGARGIPTGLTFISESGLYKLVMRSDKPEVQAFKAWVTDVVLPAIRKDGAYVMGEEKVATGEMSEDELVLKAITTTPLQHQRQSPQETRGCVLWGSRLPV